jgi:hypothetical protein
MVDGRGPVMYEFECNKVRSCFIVNVFSRKAAVHGEFQDFRAITDTTIRRIFSVNDVFLTLGKLCCKIC